MGTEELNRETKSLKENGYMFPFIIKHIHTHTTQKTEEKQIQNLFYLSVLLAFWGHIIIVTPSEWLLDPLSIFPCSCHSSSLYRESAHYWCLCHACACIYIHICVHVGVFRFWHKVQENQKHTPCFLFSSQCQEEMTKISEFGLRRTIT